MRKPGDRVDVLEEETPSPFDPSARLPETALECPSTKNSIPYCIATGRQAVPRPPRRPTGLHRAVPPPRTAPSHWLTPRRPTGLHLAVPPPPTAPSHRRPPRRPTGQPIRPPRTQAYRAGRHVPLPFVPIPRDPLGVHKARRERGPGANSCWPSRGHHPTVCWQQSPDHHMAVTWPSPDRQPTVI